MRIWAIKYSDETIEGFMGEQKSIQIYHKTIANILDRAGYWEDEYETNFNECRNTYDWYLEEDIDPEIVEYMIIDVDTDMTMEPQNASI